MYYNNAVCNIGTINIWNMAHQIFILSMCCKKSEKKDAFNLLLNYSSLKNKCFFSCLFDYTILRWCYCVIAQIKY